MMCARVCLCFNLNSDNAKTGLLWGAVGKIIKRQSVGCVGVPAHQKSHSYSEIGQLIAFCLLEGHLRGILSYFVHLRVTLVGILSCSVHWEGILLLYQAFWWINLCLTEYLMLLNKGGWLGWYGQEHDGSIWQRLRSGYFGFWLFCTVGWTHRPSLDIVGCRDIRNLTVALEGRSGVNQSQYTTWWSWISVQNVPSSWDISFGRSSITVLPSAADRNNLYEGEPRVPLERAATGETTKLTQHFTILAEFMFKTEVQMFLWVHGLYLNIDLSLQKKPKPSTSMTRLINISL